MISAALARLEDASRCRPRCAASRARCSRRSRPRCLGSTASLLSNLWLFAPLVQRELAKSAGTNAMLRTTTALTIVHAGNKDNVLPGRAEATVNFRLLPGDTKPR